MPDTTSKENKSVKTIVKSLPKAAVKVKLQTSIKSTSNPTGTTNIVSLDVSEETPVNIQNQSNVSLSKIAKAKIKPKEEVSFKPRKIEKIIDVNKIEKKLEEIMALDHMEFTVEEKLKALYVLQEIDSNIDKIRTIRGELPMEVTDLEDEIAGLTTRIQNIQDEITNLNDSVNKKKQIAKEIS